MLPKLVTEIPGPKSLLLAKDLKRYESQNVTYTSDDWPVFWQKAEGVNVWDEDGNIYLDMTAAFGVAGLGHGWAAESMREQSQEMIHGMGDVHPTSLKVDVCRMLSEMTFERWGQGVAKTILSNSGSEAVESALKTAYMASGKPAVVCFENSYHGLGYGALLGSGLEKFRAPFVTQLAPLRKVLPYPSDEASLDVFKDQLGKLGASDIGALIVEPIMGRGGKVVPPDGFLAILRSWCDEHDVILIFDEIFTGFNRTGKLFACDWQGVIPDLLCVAKAMSGGYPISACIGKAAIMDKWPVSEGEALHTSTFLGNPVGCAMAVKSLAEHAKAETSARVNRCGARLMELLRGVKSPLVHEIRGRGLMLGMELRHSDGRPAGDIAGQVLGSMMQVGVFMLADGPDGNVLAFTPPFNLTDEELVFVVEKLQHVLTNHE